MITEDYVNYETAKLLKEKGFDEECWCWYEEDGYFKDSNDDYGFQSNLDHVSDDFICSAPTLQMTMKWLREKHNLSIEPYYTHKQKYKFIIQEIPTAISLWMDLPDELYSTYETACEAAIKYCIEHLI